MKDKKRIMRRIRNSAVIKNPVLFEAVGLCPVVAIALSLKTALFLAVITMIELTLIEVLSSLLLKNVRRCWRVAIYVIFGTGILYPIVILARRFFPELTANFGIYLPLMAVNSLVALHCERVAVKNNVLESFADAMSASLSYSAVVIVVGIMREIIANGTLGGLDLNTPVKFSALLMPFGGLLIIGFTAAAMKALIAKVYPDKSPDRAFDMSEVHRSLKGSVRELFSDDYNPYDDSSESDNMESGNIFTVTPSKKADSDENKTAAEDVDKIIEEVTSKKAEEKPKKKTKKQHKEKTQKETKPKKEKIPKKKTKSKKHEEHKKVDDSFISVVPSAPQGESETSRTYLDDFSDMLSDLENYKNEKVEDSVKEETPKQEENKDGGDGE